MGGVRRRLRFTDGGSALASSRSVLVPLTWVLLDGKGAWARVRRVPWWGVPSSAEHGAPWYLAMARFAERDDERAGASWSASSATTTSTVPAPGVHTTTPGGTFTYFLEKVALAPWVLLLPLSPLFAPSAAPFTLSGVEGRRLGITMGRHLALHLRASPRARRAFTTTSCRCCPGSRCCSRAGAPIAVLPEASRTAWVPLLGAVRCRRCSGRRFQAASRHLLDPVHVQPRSPVPRRAARLTPVAFQTGAAGSP